MTKASSFAPRVLLVVNASEGWSRGIVKGFSAVAIEQGWNLRHHDPLWANLESLASSWKPVAVVLGPEVGAASLSGLCAEIAVSVNSDRTAEGMASVCLDEEQIAIAAFDHLRSRGLKNLASFRCDSSPFALEREQAFQDAAASAGICLAEAWWTARPIQTRGDENPGEIARWLMRIPKPCGIFAGCDTWASILVACACEAALRVPEDVAIVGADNDAMVCELTTPRLSSVIVPWQQVGREAAELVRLALAGRTVAGTRSLVGPADVMSRRSTDVLAIDDDLVARAVRWIHEHSNETVTVPLLARAVVTSRRRLERRFRLALGRTVAVEIRRVRVEKAKHLLSTTDYGLRDIAKMCGFGTAALLNAAFRRELGVAPGAHRRHVRDSTENAD
jgi:LacI family transcriptional regulator